MTLHSKLFGLGCGWFIGAFILSFIFHEVVGVMHPLVHLTVGAIGGGGACICWVLAELIEKKKIKD